MGAALPIIGLGAGIGGGILNAVGSYDSMKAQAANAAYQAQVAANNAAIAKQNEELEVQSGEVQAANQEMKTRSTVGTTLASQGASGVDVNSGSSVAVRSAEAELGMLDALTIRSNEARKAYGYAVAATSDTAESGLLTQESEQASAAAPISALGSFLGSVSSTAGKFGNLNLGTG